MGVRKKLGYFDYQSRNIQEIFICVRGMNPVCSIYGKGIYENVRIYRY